jgi:ABC-type glycerol-3-phosphate transport system permease component
MRAVDEARGARLVGRYIVLAVVAVIVLLPIYATLMGAFKPSTEIIDFPRSMLPVDFTLDTFREAWRTGNLGRYMLNSTIVSVLITVGQVVTSVFAGYAFAFVRFPAKRLVFALFLATLMVPGEVTILVNVDTIQNLRWIDSYQALIVPFVATAFGTFLMRQVFLTVPAELREAAALDGLGHWRFMKDVAVPLARPTIGALALFSFLSAWNQYLWPQRVTNSDKYRTVQIGLKALQSANVDKLNLIMAGTVIAAIPIFVVLVIFQRQLIRGLTAGALKG